MDNLITGKRQNISHLQDKKEFTFFQGDIQVLEACMNAVSEVDAVVHLAALGSVPRSIEFPKATEAANLGGFMNMLEACRAAGVKRFVYASSSSVYGDETTLPKVEDRIGRPLSPYAVTKLMDELYAGLYREMYGLETIGLRFFNVFGERQDPQGAYAAAIPRFLQNLMQHKAPQVHGDGSQTRDFTYVHNAASAVLCALQVETDEAYGKAFNVAYGTNKDLLALIETLKAQLAKFDASISSVKPEHIAERPGDVPHSLADISRSRALLGYEPQFDLDQGLEHAIPWYWENWR